MFLVFVLFSFLWNYLLDYLLGLVSFRADNPWILFYIKSHVTAVFCGWSRSRFSICSFNCRRGNGRYSCC